MAIDTLKWIRSTSDSVGQQVAVLLQLVVAYGTQLTLSDRENYSEQLIHLVSNRFEEAILDPAAVHLIDSLDLVLRGVSQQFAERWAEPVANIMARRKLTPSITVSPSALESVVSLDDDNIPHSLGNKLASASRLLHGDGFETTGVASDPESLIRELRDELRAAKRISTNSRKILNGEINYLELLTGVRTRQPHLMLRGANALFNQPRRMSRSDKLIAAEVTLRVLKVLPDNEFRDISPTMTSISRFISQQIEIILDNSFLRFLALNIRNIQPLVNTYLDIYFERVPVEQHSLDVLVAFQGCFYSRCVRLTGLHDSRDHAELFVTEISQLLEHAQGEYQREAGGNLTNANQTQENNRAVARPQLVLTTNADKKSELTDILRVRKHVARAEAVFIYYCTDQKVHLVIISENSVEPVTLGVSRAEVLARDGAMKTNLHTLYLSEAEDYSWIYDMLLRPGIELIGANASTASIVIVNAQMGLPFHLAYNTQSSRFLIEEFDVSYCHSVATFCRSRHASNNGVGRPRILLSGFAGSDAGRLLPLVDRELSAIQRVAHQHGYQTSAPMDMFSDVEHASYGYNVLHFAGHVTGSAATENAWTLHYRDGPVAAGRLLMALHENIALCNLLGCSSAEQIGSALIGLNGLLSAMVAWGIPNVVGFLWPVPDDIAAGISIRFYEKWLDHQGSVRACLRHSLLEEDKTWGPALWGSAVCYGA